MAGGCPNDPKKVMQNLKCVIEALKKTFSCPPACPGECCRGPAPPFPPKEPILFIDDTSLTPISILFEPKSTCCQTPRNLSKESLSIKKRSRDGRHAKACRPKLYKLESCRGSQSVCCLQRLSDTDTELRGGNLIKCVCKKHYGLQDLCEKTGCQGSPYCVSNPPLCGPSYFTKNHIGKPASKSRYYQIMRQKLSDVNRKKCMKLVRIPSETSFEDTVESKALVQPQFEDGGEYKALIKPQLYALIGLPNECDCADVVGGNNVQSVHTQTSQPHHDHRKFICKYCKKENELSASSSSKESSLDSSDAQIKIESSRYTSKMDLCIQSDRETHVFTDKPSKKQHTTKEKPAEPRNKAPVVKQATQTVERYLEPFKFFDATKTVDGQLMKKILEDLTNAIHSKLHKPSKRQSTQTDEKPAQQKNTLELRTETRKTKLKYTSVPKPRSSSLESDASTSDVSRPEPTEKDSPHLPKPPSTADKSVQTDCLCMMLRHFCDCDRKRCCDCDTPELALEHIEIHHEQELTSEREETPLRSLTSERGESPLRSLTSSIEVDLTEPDNLVAAIEDVKSEEKGAKTFYALNVTVSNAKHDPSAGENGETVPTNTPTLGAEDSSEERICAPNFANFLELPSIMENPYIKMPFVPNLTTIMDCEDSNCCKDGRCCRTVVKVGDSSSSSENNNCFEVMKKKSGFLDSDVCHSVAVTDLSSSGLSVQYECDNSSNAKNCADKSSKKVRFKSCPDLCCDNQ